MAWYEDLALCDYFGGGPTHLKAVGWLSRGKPFASGEVPTGAFEKLCELLVTPWNPAATAGAHFCELCRFSGGNGAVRFKEFQFSGVCNQSLFVPGRGVIHVAPASISHTIDAHGYNPPTEFWDAVMACPPMRSAAYFKALLSNGGRELVKSTNSTSAPEE